MAKRTNSLKVNLGRRACCSRWLDTNSLRKSFLMSNRTISLVSLSTSSADNLSGDSVPEDGPTLRRITKTSATIDTTVARLAATTRRKLVERKGTTLLLKAERNV